MISGKSKIEKSVTMLKRKKEELRRVLEEKKVKFKDFKRIKRQRQKMADEPSIELLNKLSVDICSRHLVNESTAGASMERDELNMILHPIPSKEVTKPTCPETTESRTKSRTFQT